MILNKSKAEWDAWFYNTQKKIMGKLVRALQLEPYCTCGWPLAQGRSTSTWICGACMNREREKS